MTKPKEGDRVRIVERPVTITDRKDRRYYAHMAGLVGTVTNVYSADEVAVRVDPATLPEVTADVHKIAAERMRTKILAEFSEEARRQLSPEERNFDVHFMVLVRSEDLEPA